MMTESFAGKINGKQKAIGFILLFPLYLYVIPRFANFGIYSFIKVYKYYKRYDSFRNLL